MDHSRTLFIYFFLFNTVYGKQMFNLNVADDWIRTRTSGIGSNHSTNWATTTYQNNSFFSHKLIGTTTYLMLICENNDKIQNRDRNLEWPKFEKPTTWMLKQSISMWILHMPPCISMTQTGQQILPSFTVKSPSRVNDDPREKWEWNMHYEWIRV